MVHTRAGRVSWGGGEAEIFFFFGAEMSTV